MYKSGNHQLFPKVYLNLLFIGQKIRITGPADLLVDIRKYHEFIVADVSYIFSISATEFNRAS